MIDFGAVIVRYGAEAVQEQLREHQDWDAPVLELLANKNATGRGEGLCRWLTHYGVFQGFSADKRREIASAVLRWADGRDLQVSLDTVDAVVQAHAELFAVCSDAYATSRVFTSLASKALWLCYPYDVPMFDSFAQRALWIIAKLNDVKEEEGKGAREKTEYSRFAYIWKALYRDYQAPLHGIDLREYPYRVRIFDKILWRIGYPDYKYENS